MMAEYKANSFSLPFFITKADKGGAFVIVDVDDYVQKANRQLDNKEFYSK